MANRCVHKKGSKGQVLNMKDNSSLQLTPEAPHDGNATGDIVPDPIDRVKSTANKMPTSSKETPSILTPLLSMIMDNVFLEAEPMGAARGFF